MRRVLFFFALCVCVGVFGICAAPTAAQSASAGSISGQVTDPQGATVPGVDVTLVEVATKSPRSTVTNDSGRYIFAVVPPGMYEITVSKSGFKVHKLTGERVSVGLVLTVDVTLELGSVSETVTITSATGSELQTTNSTIGTTISGKELELLPNLGRDAT